MDFPTALILDGLDNIMRHNVFTFWSRGFLQIDGIVMATLCAFKNATIYYTCHEETNFLTNDAHLLLFYCKLSDNEYIIHWASPNKYANFVSSMNDFGEPRAQLE
jgi:hypothetical protein